MTKPREMTDDKFDALLRDWAAAQAVGPEALDRLRANVRIAAGSPPANTSSAMSPRTSRSSEIMAVCCSVAVVLVMAVTVFTLSPASNHRQVAQHKLLDEPGRLDDLWQQTSSLFGSDLVWMCDLDGELLLGVDGRHTTTEVDGRVCLKLIARVYDARAGHWVQFASGRMVCPLGTPVDFASSDHRSAGSFWIQTLPDGRFVVSSWMRWAEHPEISGSIDNTSSSGEVRVVTDQVADGQRVQVLQQVWRPRLG